jgi:hypothetical protein
MTDKVTFYLRDHQGKGKAYISAMEMVGWKELRESSSPTLGFYDSDVTSFRVKRINDMPNSLIFLYGHTARPPLWYDFREFHPHPRTKAIFVPAIGHKQVLDRIGVEKPVHVVGFSLCEQKEFEASNRLQRITFAPIHANMNGWNAAVNQEINQKVMARLLKEREAHHLDITVRFVRSLESCGLRRESGVKYVFGQTDQSHKEIDQADLVIGTETYAYLAIARGKPTLMMAENIPPRIGNTPDNFDYVKSWDKYKDIMEYPLDALSPDKDLWTIMQSACQPRQDVQEWCKRMIGELFSPKELIKILEGYIKELIV